MSIATDAGRSACKLDVPWSRETGETITIKCNVTVWSLRKIFGLSTERQRDRGASKDSRSDAAAPSWQRETGRILIKMAFERS